MRQWANEREIIIHMPRHACGNEDTQPIRDTAIIERPDPYRRLTRILQYCASALAAALITLTIVGTVGYLGTPTAQSSNMPTVTVPDAPTPTPEATPSDTPTEVPEVPAEIPSAAPPAKLPLAQPTPSAPVIMVPVPTQVVTPDPVPELTPDPEPTVAPPVEDNPKPRHHVRQTTRNSPPAPLEINLGNLLP